MTKTLKIRKGPSSSATKFSVGTKKKGKDIYNDTYYFKV